MIDNGREYIMRYDHGLDVMVSAAEPIEIVRCKDCKHMVIREGKKVCAARQRYSFATNDSDFCSRGERRGA